MLEIIEAQINTNTRSGPGIDTNKTGVDKSKTLPEMSREKTLPNEPETQQLAPDDTSEPAADTDEGDFNREGEIDTEPVDDPNKRPWHGGKLPQILAAVGAVGLIIWWVKRKKKQEQVQGWTPPRIGR